MSWASENHKEPVTPYNHTQCGHHTYGREVLSSSGYNPNKAENT